MTGLLCWSIEYMLKLMVAFIKQLQISIFCKGFYSMKKFYICIIITVFTVPLWSVVEPLFDLTALKDHQYSRGIYFTDQSWFVDFLRNTSLKMSQLNHRRYIHAVLK